MSAHSHDYYAERLTDAELELGITTRTTTIWAARHDLQRQQFGLDRLIRERQRRADVRGDATE